MGDLLKKVVSAIRSLGVACFGGLAVYVIVREMQSEGVTFVWILLLVQFGFVTLGALASIVGTVSEAYMGSSIAGYYDDISGAFSRRFRSGRRRKLLVAVRNYDHGNYEKAIAKLEKLLKLCETTRDIQVVQRFLGRAYEANGQPDEAVEACRAIAEDVGNEPELWRELADLQRTIGRPADAVESWKKEISCRIENNADGFVPGVRVYADIAEACLDMNQYDKAIEQAQKGLEVNARSDRLLLVLCRAYNALGDTEKFEGYCEEFLDAGGSRSAVDAIKNGTIAQ